MANYEEIVKIIDKVRGEILIRQAKYLDKRVKGEPTDDDEIKELNSLKKELKFIEKMYSEATGVKGGTNKKELSADLLRNISLLKPLISSIVRDMPKTQVNEA